MSAPPRADFLYTALRSGSFKASELIDLFGWDSVEATVKLAIEYSDTGSILVLSSKRVEYLNLLSELTAAQLASASGRASLPQSIR